MMHDRADVRITPSKGGVDERAIAGWYDEQGLAARRWSSAAGDRFAPHRHAYHKVLHCLRGSITFQIVAHGRIFELKPGDRLDVPAGVEHSAVAGPQGCDCIEAPVY